MFSEMACAIGTVQNREVEGKFKTDMMCWMQFSDSNIEGSLSYIVRLQTHSYGRYGVEQLHWSASHNCTVFRTVFPHSSCHRYLFSSNLNNPNPRPLVVSFPDGLHHLSRSHVGVRKSENTKWCYRLVTFGRAGVGKASRALDSASTTSCTVLSIIV